MPIRFGPQDLLAVYPTGDLSSTARSLQDAAALGLTCYEYAWTSPDAILVDPRIQPREAATQLADRGVESYMHIRGHEGRDTLRLVKVGKRDPKSRRAPDGMELSMRESFNWNLASEESSLTQTLYLFRNMVGAARRIGVTRVSLHMGSAAGRDRDKALDTALENLEILCQTRRRMRARKLALCVETAARPDDIGTLEEVARLCQVDDLVYPSLHVARLGVVTDGSLLSADTYGQVLDYLKGTVGEEKASRVHIEFSPLVSRRAAEAGPDAGEERSWERYFAPLAAAVAQRGLSPWIIFSDRDPDWPDATVEEEDLQARAAARMRDIYMSEKDSLF